MLEYAEIYRYNILKYGGVPDYGMENPWKEAVVFLQVPAARTISLINLSET